MVAGGASEVVVPDPEESVAGGWLAVGAVVGSVVVCPVGELSDVGSETAGVLAELSVDEPETTGVVGELSVAESEFVAGLVVAPVGSAVVASEVVPSDDCTVVPELSVEGSEVIAGAEASELVDEGAEEAVVSVV